VREGGRGGAGFNLDKESRWINRAIGGEELFN